MKREEMDKAMIGLAKLEKDLKDYHDLIKPLIDYLVKSEHVKEGYYKYGVTIKIKGDNGYICESKINKVND